MKKKILMFMILSLFFVPGNVWAKAEDYTSMGLREACESEKIPFNHPDYKEGEEKANIYLFRGSGCSHCYDFLTYLEAITEEYGDTFNLISYEVWNNEMNHTLLGKVAKKLGDDVTGVPYIIIGKNTWGGYSESLNEEIFQAIQEEYKNKNKNDVVTKVVNYEKKFGITDIIIPGVFLLFVFLIIYARRKMGKEELETSQE